MKRIIFMILKNIIYVPGMLIRLLRCAANVDKYTDVERNQLLKEIVGRANRGGNVTIEVTGVENIPNENGFIMYPNHQGMYDMLALIDVCPRPLSVVSKKEVAKIPLLRSVFKVDKAIFIDRENVKQSMQVIMQVAKEVSAGRNFVIFPEGTRSKKGNIVGDFKGGSFKAATKAKCPIVPVALIDSFKPFDTNSLEKVTVQVHILESLLYEEYKDMKTVEIAEEVKRRIVDVVEHQKK
ncbi:MAG: 1-acyl-sn-glycerol-3-phosphate acyltransferase [Tyzzerella sp.]|nr:1-acyl-sn-glycerol-3-phosphate acyltransferase [Tyzzerella sp.]